MDQQTTPITSPYPSSSDSSSSATTSPSSAPFTPQLSNTLFTPEDEDLLWSVMNTNTPVENNNYWFPATHETHLASLDSILDLDTSKTDPNKNDNSDLAKKRAAQSSASKRYRQKKKATSEFLTHENGVLKRELQIAQQQISQLSLQVVSLQNELTNTQASLQAALTKAQQQQEQVQHKTQIPKQLQQQIGILKDELTVTFQQLQLSLQACAQLRVDMNATYELCPLLQTHNVKVLLDTAHTLILQHHQCLTSFAQSNITPDNHAYWALFEPPQSGLHEPFRIPEECLFAVSDQNNEWWRDYAASAKASIDQLNRISALQKRYCHTATRIKKERYQYSLQVREFYWNRIYRIQFRFPGPTNPESQASFQIAQVELLCKLQLLKKNCEEERTLLTDTYAELSTILHPLQEAMLLVRLYQEAQSHLDHFHAVHTIWELMGGVVEEQKGCLNM